MVEPGQGWKTAALISSMCVHHFFWGDFLNNHYKFMNLAIKQANKALIHGDFPVGVVIVCNGKVISKAYNKKIKCNNALLHAELIAIFNACKKRKSWRLNDCSLYVTLEPCNMCFNAIVEARISNVYYIADSNYVKTQLNSTKNVNKIKIKDEYNYDKLLSNFFIR